MTDPLVDLQRQITTIVLAAIEDCGFALAGSGAIREHGLTNRPTLDVDLFTTVNAIGERFGQSITAAEVALSASGFRVTRRRETDGFAELAVQDMDDQTVQLELGVDWRSLPPVQLVVGPVLAIDDAVGNKLAALYSRQELRDFLDVDAIRRSGRFASTYGCDAPEFQQVQDRLVGWGAKVLGGERS